MNKKLWIWNHYASDMYRNKGGRHYWFAKNLVNKGYDVTIFCSNTFHNSEDTIPIENGKIFNKDEIEGIKFVFIRTTPFRGNGVDRVKNMFDFYKNIKKVARDNIKKENKPNYILASSVHPLTMLAGVQTGNKYKIPCISEVRDLWPEAIFQFGYLKENSLIGKMLIAGEKYIYEKSAALIFTKPGDKDYILEKKWDTDQGGKIDLNKVFYINNGVDLQSFNNQKNSNCLNDKDLCDSSFKIIYTGTIKPVNNIDFILDTAKELSKQEDIKFLIYGSGSEETRIKNRITDEKIHNVVLKGRVDKKYIPFILSQSSINLLNYSQEQYNWKRGNSSNKLFEYLASGKPVLSTVKMGYSLIEKYNCGFEIDNPKPIELAKKINEIKQMSKNDYNKLSINAKKASENFDFSKLTEDLENVVLYIESQ